MDKPREGEICRIGDKSVIPLTFGRARIVLDDPRDPENSILDGW